jgi:hypothetical protein
MVKCLMVVNLVILAVEKVDIAVNYRGNFIILAQIASRGGWIQTFDPRVTS